MSTDGPVSRTVTIINRKGLHARASARFVAVAEASPARATVEKDGERVDARSIMGLLTLAAAMGQNITITAEGEEAPALLAALVDLVETGFGENR